MSKTFLEVGKKNYLFDAQRPVRRLDWRSSPCLCVCVLVVIGEHQVPAQSILIPIEYRLVPGADTNLLDQESGPASARLAFSGWLRLTLARAAAMQGTKVSS